jgi:hypothetical protein
MSYLELKSVGSLLTNKGVVFPLDISEAPETASDADRMMGVPLKETCEEWFQSLSYLDYRSLITFLLVSSQSKSEISQEVREYEAEILYR